MIKKDPHFTQGCISCHQGNPAGTTKAIAHAGMDKRPSDDPETCASCHGDIAKTYTLSLHYTTAGMKNGVRPRFSEAEAKVYDQKVFEQSCRSCHASCGDCHVKSPIISGVNIGLIAGHDFVKKNEDKTCALCHGGRVYPEFTGEYGGTPDVHYQKGMNCVDCHPGSEFHGTGTAYTGRRDVAEKPTCIGCHPAGSETTDASKEAHGDHGDKVSCSACHSGAEYRGCNSCHLGEGAVSSPQFILGDNPRNPGQLTTLRMVPTIRETFKNVGIEQKNFDALPNLWDAVPHNTRKRTERTRDCATCHYESAKFLTEEELPPEGSKANQKLIFNMSH